MKQKLIIFSVVIGIGSCSSPESPNRAEADQNLIALESTEIDSNILGEWALCKANLVSYNVCPIVNFNTNGLGDAIDASGDKKKFEWIFTKKSRILIKAEEICVLKSGTYDIAFQNKENYVQLQMKSINENLVYILGKSNQ